MPRLDNRELVAGLSQRLMKAAVANAQLYEHNATLWTDMPEVGEPPIGVVLR